MKITLYFWKRVIVGVSINYQHCLGIGEEERERSLFFLKSSFTEVQLDWECFQKFSLKLCEYQLPATTPLTWHRYEPSTRKITTSANLNIRNLCHWMHTWCYIWISAYDVIACCDGLVTPQSTVRIHFIAGSSLFSNIPFYVDRCLNSFAKQTNSSQINAH